MTYIEIERDTRLWELAQARAERTPVYEGSHRGRDANTVGALGEAVAEHWLEREGIRFERVADERTDYDYELADCTLEVKTKDRTVPPIPGYECSVPLYNHDHQRPDYYLFVSLEREKNSSRNDVTRFHTAWIVGIANQELIRRHGVQWEGNQTDPANGTTFWTSCLNVRMENLFTPQRAARSWRRAQESDA